MIPKLIDSVCNLVISGDEIIIIAMISRYFLVWSNIDEKFVKNFPYSLIFCNKAAVITFTAANNNNVVKIVITFYCNL